MRVSTSCIRASTSDGTVPSFAVVSLVVEDLVDGLSDVDRLHIVLHMGGVELSSREGGGEGSLSRSTMVMGTRSFQLGSATKALYLATHGRQISCARCVGGS